MIKLIASDIDGTLVKDGESEVNPEIFQEILRLRAKGIQFAAASGRQWCSIERTFDPIKEKIFYVSDNGAYVGCHGRNLFLTTVDRDAVFDMVRDIKQCDDLELMVSCADYVYMDTKNAEFFDWMKYGYKYSIRETNDLFSIEEPIIKVAVYRKSQIEAGVAAIREKYKDKFKITISGDMWMDCMAPGVNKGAAIQEIQESLGILPEETMAFGDQLNDIEMLGRAHYSYAVGNARPEVKKIARFQADSNVNDGVLKVLRLL